MLGHWAFNYKKTTIDQYSKCVLAAGNYEAQLAILCFHTGHLVH